ncbi:hypothetical protein [Thiomicrorhabdus indica]|uniref:hypothetical protein n=1 Tax=Thiomicrorhabdus indica TaxID=2267253 RepID=UPI002AA6F092|nr:hypothetical protein [Thiomicrorhabdus indica]
MKFLNAIFRLFGYEWVEDKQPNVKGEDKDEGKCEDLIADEGWDDLHQHSPRYRLQKSQSIDDKSDQL